MSVRAPAAERGRRIPGEAGVWVFILGDMLVFAVLFGVLVATQADDPALYERSQNELHVGLGALNTAWLLTSSLAVALGVRAARAQDGGAAARLFLAAVGCAIAFIAFKAVEYADLLGAGHGARENDFFQYFYCATGLHLLHVAIGIGVLGAAIRLVRRPPLSSRDLGAVESCTSYWHMVDLLWIVLFALLYLLG
ncbi:MAG TPA: cytochrome c oxidase subunit 3 [Baekduia sp.]|nr:cytochrome c oxidase subunit 3 [Baekduia sp.]